MSEYNYCANCANTESRKFYVHPCPSCVHGNKEWFELDDGREPPPSDGWTDIEEELPDMGAGVMVYPIDDGIEIAEYLGGGDWRCGPCVFSGERLTHWRLMPAPPTP